MLSVKHLAAAAAIVPTLAIGMAAVPASAAPVIRTTAGIAAAKGPITDIEGKSAKVAVYKPTKLSAKTITGTCSTTNFSFAVINATKVKETITYGTESLPLKPKYGEVFCATSGSGVTKFGLKGNKKAVLTVTLS
jgi:hypothetical protein